MKYPGVMVVVSLALALAGCAGTAERSGRDAAVGEAAEAAVAAPPAASSASTAAPATPAVADPLARFATPAEGIRSGGRISATDLPALQAAGVTRVIDLTPDAETPDFDEAAAVRAAGLRYDNLPIAGAVDLDREAVEAFDALLAKDAGPALVHCASGNRVGALAALRAAWLQGADDDAALAEGRRWGLTGLEPVVRQQLLRERCLAEAGSAAHAGDATRCDAG